jgi:hypothetical protein
LEGLPGGGTITSQDWFGSYFIDCREGRIGIFSATLFLLLLLGGG